MAKEPEQATEATLPEEHVEEQVIDRSAALQKTADYRKKIYDGLPKASRDGFDDWWEALVEEVTRDDFVVEGTMLRSLERRIEEIDQQMSEQLAALLHHEEFQSLEGTWRGLKRFVTNTMTQKGVLEIEVLNCTKDELTDDQSDAGVPHKSKLYEKTYQDTFNKFGGVPYGILVADFEWTRNPKDIATLKKLAKTVSASHTSLITAPGPELFGYDSWEHLKGTDTQDYANIFMGAECIEWRDFRETDESRYLTMAMPRTMARLPYGQQHDQIKEFDFEEFSLGEADEAIEQAHEKFCWSNAAYALAERITEAFFVWGWTTAIRGVEGGGMMHDLPIYKYKSPDGDTKVKCPTEFSLNFEQSFALSNQGFMPISYYLETNRAVFDGGQTTHKPRDVVEDDAQESENLSARLPYMLAASRVSHFLKAIAHDKIGDFVERDECERWLTNWITTYVDTSEGPTKEQKARRPFQSAKVKVSKVPGDAGVYHAEIQIRPWIQLERLTADVTLVSDIETGN